MQLVVMFAVLVVLSCRSAHAQETFFQVPSAAVPEPWQAHSQLQGSYGNQLDLSGTLGLGLPFDFELGATFYNMEVERREYRFALARNARVGREPLAPIVVGFGQKTFELSEAWEIALAAQLGASAVRRRRDTVVARGYALISFHRGNNTRCALGPYVATMGFLGNHQHFGALLGCELEVVPEILAVEMDWDVGAHAHGLLSIGPRLQLGDCCALTIGAQIPNRWGPASWQGVAQLDVSYPGEQK